MIAGNDSKMGSIGELTAKLQLAQRKIALSLELTRRAGRFYPRLEGLVEQLRLDTFEKNVLLYPLRLTSMATGTLT